MAQDDGIGQLKTVRPTDKQAPALSKNRPARGLNIAYFGLYERGLLGHARHCHSLAKALLVGGKEPVQRASHGLNGFGGNRPVEYDHICIAPLPLLVSTEKPTVVVCPSALYINALALNDILRLFGKFFGFFFFAVDQQCKVKRHFNAGLTFRAR